MPNPLLPGKETKPVMKGHGRAGCVRIGVDVTPELKDDLIALARADGVPLSRLCAGILSTHATLYAPFASLQNHGG